MKPAQVLIVDDNLLNLELATEVLQAVGHTVRQARSAEECLRSARSEPPDLILLDIGLPGMDGYAAMRALRADPRIRHVPTLALTAFAMAEDQERAKAAGFDGFISKPIQTRELPDTIARFLERHREAR